jgi:hypothetical protein
MLIDDSSKTNFQKATVGTEGQPEHYSPASRFPLPFHIMTGPVRQEKKLRL